MVVIRVKTVGHNNVTILSQKSQNIGIAVLLVVVKEKREFRTVATFRLVRSSRCYGVHTCGAGL